MESGEQDPPYFAVYPITNCPHLSQDAPQMLDDLLTQKGRSLCSSLCETTDCSVDHENWVCLECNALKCSRYQQKHMLAHVSEEDHVTAFSLADGSFWCFKCDDYITNDELRKVSSRYGRIKHPEDNQDPDINELVKGIEQLKLFSYDDIIDQVKEKKIKKVSFMTGAGISTSCGIPDFRTPGTGLYDNLQEYNLERPEQIFELAYFLENPKPFYTFCKEFLNIKTDDKYQPSVAHQLMAEFDRQAQLRLVFTQNIDSLELKTTLDPNKLIQAHGNAHHVHCPHCPGKYPIDQFKEYIHKDQVLRCKKKNCHRPLKPTIVFFGEGLPQEFFQKMESFQECDMLVIMGTSLKVYPFCLLVEQVNEDVPILVINAECDEQLLKKKNLLFLKGDIDTTCRKMAEDLGWSLP